MGGGDGGGGPASSGKRAKLIAPVVAGAMSQNAKFSTSPRDAMVHRVKTGAYGAGKTTRPRRR